MTIYKTKVFDKWARNNDLSDLSLCNAVKEMKVGLFDADLGGGLFKKRVAKSGGGKRGGFRTLLATNRNDKWFFVFGFEKNARDNIDMVEEKALRKYTNELLSYTKTSIDKLENDGKIIRIECHEKEKISDS